MRPAVWLALAALAALAACGQRDPTTTVVYAPTAHETRTVAIAEQRASLRAEERASRSRTEIRTEIRTRRAETPRRVRAASALSSQGIWPCIRFHESGGNYRRNSGNGYYGAYQFLPATWNTAARGAGYPQYANGRADLAPPAVQDDAAIWLQAHVGWGPWPQTSRICRLR